MGGLFKQFSVVLRSQNYTKDALNIDVLATTERHRGPHLVRPTHILDFVLIVQAFNESLRCCSRLSCCSEENGKYSENALADSEKLVPSALPSSLRAT